MGPLFFDGFGFEVAGLTPELVGPPADGGDALAGVALDAHGLGRVAGPYGGGDESAHRADDEEGLEIRGHLGILHTSQRKAA